MVGPATIWVSMEIGRQLAAPLDVLLIGAVLAVNFVIVVVAQRFLSRMEGKKESLVGAYFTILMRTNALFIGAIGIEMILAGLSGVGAISRPN
jgi:small neutral amino acid transporter SnatA (MarC family)